MDLVQFLFLFPQSRLGLKASSSKPGKQRTWTVVCSKTMVLNGLTTDINLDKDAKAISNWCMIINHLDVEAISTTNYNEWMWITNHSSASCNLLCSQDCSHVLMHNHHMPISNVHIRANCSSRCFRVLHWPGILSLHFVAIGCRCHVQVFSPNQCKY